MHQKITIPFLAIALFYQMTYAICKQLLPNISIGGGTFVMTNRLEVRSFINEELSDCTFDFYSFALFPYSNRLVRETETING